MTKTFKTPTKVTLIPSYKSKAPIENLEGVVAYTENLWTVTVTFANGSQETFYSIEEIILN